jgi:hypothetical protein
VAVPTKSSVNVSSVHQHTSPTSLVSQVNDIHSQMVLMMTESFSKLSTVIVESKQDSKSDWPNFSGEHKKFQDWY